MDRGHYLKKQFSSPLSELIQSQLKKDEIVRAFRIEVQTDDRVFFISNPSNPASNALTWFSFYWKNLLTR